MWAGTPQKTVALLYLLLGTLFQRLVCGANRLQTVAARSIDSLPSFVVWELQLSSPTQKFTLLPYASRTRENIPGPQLQNRACRPGNKHTANTYLHFKTPNGETWKQSHLLQTGRRLPLSLILAFFGAGRVWTQIRELDASKVGQTFLVRARVHNRRGAGEHVWLRMGNYGLIGRGGEGRGGVYFQPEWLLTFFWWEE